MRIALLHYSAPPIVGGVESVLYHQARFLKEYGHEVHIIAGRGNTWSAEIPFHRIPLIDSKHPEILAVNKALARGQVPDAFYRLRDDIQQAIAPLLSSLEVVIAHNVLTLHKNLPLTAALYELIARQRLVPLVAFAHDLAWKDELYLPELHEGYPWDLLRTPWPHVQYVAISKHRQEWLAELFGWAPEKIPVIYPGIDAESFLELEPLTRSLNRQLHLFQADPLFLYPTRITRRKNIEGALHIMAHLKTYYPHIQLLITGPPGPHNTANQQYLQELQQLRHSLGLHSHVHFLYEYGTDGSAPLLLPDSVIADLYRMSDAMLFTSKREGFGIPVLEAGLIHLPIFAYPLPSFQESADDLIHYLPPTAPPEHQAAMIHQILQQYPAHILRRRIIRSFTYQTIIPHQLLPLLQSVTEAQAHS